SALNRTALCWLPLRFTGIRTAQKIRRSLRIWKYLLVGVLWKRADWWCILNYKIYYLQLSALSSKDT
ncbi:MAG: hypothetical protein OXI63_10265, partial [Candidatus Poribacteria bacterium]|nr:hypothetical protein [Candidatus Poribacteria bacterium]